MLDRELILFHTALLNQNRTRENDFDMTISIRTTNKLIMPIDYGSDKYQVYDATEIIVHEILHGMGISSSATYIRKEGVKYIGPRYFPENKNGLRTIYFGNGIYDKYLYSDGESMHDIVQSMTVKNISYRQANAYIQNIPKLPQLKKIEAFHAGNNPVYFKTKYNKTVRIQTSKTKFFLDHLSSENFRHSLDHIMTPYSKYYPHVIQYKTLVQGWKTAPLGNNTIDILETLGYEKNPFPQRKKSQLALYEEMQKYSYKPWDVRFKN
ncbi:hypothetical protein DSO57_1015766 [Entomophthora muscae]|uniref:Uncharacterized protein n=1 Tax=Entomophthora muscae TaxID=34485 RepID=A0ACC2SHS6_9FUNG|nr:hypothetical protein DSO57_1015766 [Entomophthora muscae]